MDSLATLEIAGFGYGIRYAHGLFKQGFDDGWQVERPESWLAFGNPWEFERPEAVYPVRFFGQVREERSADGRIAWILGGRRPGPGGRLRYSGGGLEGQAGQHAAPVVGRSSGNLIDLDAFNRGDYMAAVEDQVMAESISRVLYPADANEAGQVLRLKQEYFFTSASLQDLIRRHLSYHASLDSLPDAVAIQLNDTHPAIAVPELMRLLCDEHGYEFDAAWAITRKVINYTNHTLMPEALERWAVPLLEHLLPRHMQLIYAINAKVLGELRVQPDNQRSLPHRDLGDRRILWPLGAHGPSGLPGRQ